MFKFRDNRLRVPETDVQVTITWELTEGLDADDEIRRIVREEMADLVPVDVPDAPPKDLR